MLFTPSIQKLKYDNLFQLFDIIRSECPSATKELHQTAVIISSFYRRICAGQTTTVMKSANLESQSKNRKSMIDLDYVNNPDLSDITFLVNAYTTYGKREPIIYDHVN